MEVAEFLGVIPGKVCQPVVAQTPDNVELTYVQDSYQIPELDTTLCASLIQQAAQLANESKDTFWLDPATLVADAPNNLSLLERLALKVYLFHEMKYQLPAGGAEWWVQVKTMESTHVPEDLILSTPGNPAEAVDLHYDKDEDLAEHFDIGSFPTLSTVTYLTPASNPTLILPRRHDEAMDDFMTHMLVSHPKEGKHIVFDGRLLHGAPSHPALRQLPTPTTSGSNVRVTFLLNMWTTKPCGIKPLPDAIRDILNGIQTNDHALGNSITFSKQSLTTVSVSSMDDLPSHLQGRVCIPFLDKSATWAIDDDSESLFLVCYPPPPVDESGATLVIQFGEGMEAYLDLSGGDDDYEQLEAEHEGDEKVARQEEYV